MKDNSGCILLLYKTARTDYNLLDEVVGAMNWKCDYKEIKGNLYCEIAIYNKDLQQWISKSNCGVESNTEAEKGEASDSLKRAGFVWGIGRELYTAPFTYIKLTPDDFSNSKLKTTFKVKEIGYTNRTITKLVIEDNKGNIRFKYGNVEKAENNDFKKEDNKIIKQDIKTSKNAEIKGVDNDLPFLDIQEKNIHALEIIRNEIEKNCKALDKKPSECYGYFCKEWKVSDPSELNEKQLNEINDKLVSALFRLKQKEEEHDNSNI